MLRASDVCNEKAASARQRQRRRVGTGEDDLESRVRRAKNLVHVGEVSSARQALEGAAVALGAQATLDKLQGVRWRPPQPREALPPRSWVSNHQRCSSWMRNYLAETFVHLAEVSRGDLLA